MDNVDFLNIGYIFLSLLNLIQGVNVDTSTVPAHIAYIAGQIFILGSALAVLLVGLLTYVRIRLAIVEHQGFHGDHADHGEGHGHAEPHPGHTESEIIGTHKNERWEHILSLASSTNEGDWRRAIIEADIMLGNLLSDQGYRGNTIGDQLKDVNPLQFTTIDIAWQAHKMRNDIAHGGESFKLTERDTRATIGQYARVFGEFGII